MKRSEAIMYLINYLKPYILYEHKNEIKYIAVTVLDLCEDLGMRPPYNGANDDGEDDMEWEAE